MYNSGYIVTVIDIKKLLDYDIEITKSLFSSLPYGQNFSYSNNSITYIDKVFHNSHTELKNILKLEKINHSCKIVLTEQQYKDIKKINNELVYKATKCSYNPENSKIMYYQLKTVDLYPLLEIEDDIVNKLLDSFPLSVNYFGRPITINGNVEMIFSKYYEYLYDDFLSVEKRYSFYTTDITIRQHIKFIDLTKACWMRLSIDQYNTLAQIKTKYTHINI